MDGRVEGGEIVFQVTSSNGESATVILDTGFTGEVALDLETAARLGFSQATRSQRVELADGTVTHFEAARGRLFWLGSHRSVLAPLADTESGSIGMGMLRDVIVHIDTHAGVASIDRAV